MTEDNRRASVIDEMARADQAMRAADALIGLGLHADSVSRAYYAVFHCLRALLVSRGIEPRTHSGAIHLFNREFVRAGAFSSAHNRLLAGLQRSRELADYDAGVTFGPDDARRQLDDARAFANETTVFLAGEGWISAPPGTS